MLHNSLKNKGKYCLTEGVRGQGVLQINALVMIEVPGMSGDHLWVYCLEHPEWVVKFILGAVLGAWAHPGCSLPVLLFDS